MIDTDCLISYLESRRDMQSWSDEEWDAATAVIDWLRAQLELVKQFPIKPRKEKPKPLEWRVER